MRGAPRLPWLLPLLLAACASAPPPPGQHASRAALVQAALPGQATRASLLAALGPTQVQAFANGYEVWLYQSEQGEFVVLLGPDGVVRKVRDGPPAARAP